MQTKLIIAGGRDFNDIGLMKATLDTYYTGRFLEIVAGGARGADSLGEQLAILGGVKFTKFPAYWDKYGKSAGYRRNVEMANYVNELLAFWDGKSRGTKHMIDIMSKLGKPVRVVNY